MSEWGGVHRLSVSVRLLGGEVLDGEIYLQPRAPHHSGSETPLDLLDREERFFPLALPGDEVVFLAKAQVALLICDPAPPESELDRLGVTRFLEMELGLADGLTIRGRAGVTLPPTRQRALDCLNDGSGFLAFWVDQAAYYVNRAHLRIVRPIE